MSKINTVGRHSAKVESAEFGESDKGTPYLRIQFVSEDGESAIAGFLYLSEKALANSVNTLRDAFGFDGNFETVIDQITDKPCSITNECEEYEGKDRVKVKWINGPRTSKPIENQSSFLKTLSAKAARIPAKAPAGAAPTRAQAARPAAAAPARRPAPVATNAAVDEDIPF